VRVCRRPRQKIFINDLPCFFASDDSLLGNLFEFFETLKSCRVHIVVVTDIEMDGTLGGINLPKIRKIIDACPCAVIISGGVSSIEDIRSLCTLEENAAGKLEGVIVGKALYEGKLFLKDAYQALRKRV